MNKLADSPAFPHTVSFTPDSDGLGSTAHVVQQGLTKREYFAGLAMQGLCANQNYTRSIGGVYRDEQSEPAETCLARNAVAMSDALLAELAKTTSQSC